MKVNLKKFVVPLSIALIGTNTIISNAINITDINGHWANNEITKFVNNNYILGYEDNTFKPNNSITRAEFVSILNRVFNLTTSSGKVFNDTNNHWAKQAIDIAVTNGVCNGKSNNLFYPNDKLTRQEASVMLSNYLKLQDTQLDKINSFYDSHTISDWALYSIEGMLENGFMNGYPTGLLKPLNNITRAEAVVLINNVISNNNSNGNQNTNKQAISFSELATLMPSLGFDEMGAYRENSQRMCTSYANDEVFGIILEKESPTFNAVVKKIFNMLLPTQGDRLYEIVSNPFEDQVLEMDGRIVEIKKYPQWVSVNITNK